MEKTLPLFPLLDYNIIRYLIVSVRQRKKSAPETLKGKSISFFFFNIIRQIHKGGGEKSTANVGSTFAPSRAGRMALKKNTKIN